MKAKCGGTEGHKIYVIHIAIKKVTKRKLAQHLMCGILKWLNTRVQYFQFLTSMVYCLGYDSWLSINPL